MIAGEHLGALSEGWRSSVWIFQSGRILTRKIYQNFGLGLITQASTIFYAHSLAVIGGLEKSREIILPLLLFSSVFKR